MEQRILGNGWSGLGKRIWGVVKRDIGDILHKGDSMVRKHRPQLLLLSGLIVGYALLTLLVYLCFPAESLTPVQPNPLLVVDTPRWQLGAIAAGAVLGGPLRFHPAPRAPSHCGSVARQCPGCVRLCCGSPSRTHVSVGGDRPPPHTTVAAGIPLFAQWACWSGVWLVLSARRLGHCSGDSLLDRHPLPRGLSALERWLTSLLVKSSGEGV